MKVRTFPDDAYIDLMVLLGVYGPLFRTQALPVVGCALGNAESYAVFQAVIRALLPTQEIRAQVEFLMFRNGAGNAGGIVMCFDLIMAQAYHPALFTGLLLSGFSKNALLFETLVRHVGPTTVAVTAAFIAYDVDVVQIVQTHL